MTVPAREMLCRRCGHEEHESACTEGAAASCGCPCSPCDDHLKEFNRQKAEGTK